MRIFYRSLLTIVFLFSACGVSGRLNAQVLEQRPAQQPEPHAQAPNPAVPEARPDKPVIPAGTSLSVELRRHYPMRANETIEAELLHPIYTDGVLAIPQNTMLRGTVAALEPDSKTRWHARLRGDFTPFHKVRVRFDELELPTGSVPLTTSAVADGAPVLYLAAAGAVPHRSPIARAWAQGMATLRERVAYFTAPGLGDRALQLLYHQLPYHPERIEAHTGWSFELSAPLGLPAWPQGAARPTSVVMTPPGRPETWLVHAILIEKVSSATAKPGDPVEAKVTEPVYDAGHSLVVPQDSTLVGKVTTARAAGSLGRNGKLRFTFQQVRFPQGPERAVQGALAGATTEQEHGLSLDAEGTISPKNQSSAIAPIVLTLLAGRALDSDGNLTAGTGVASNGFGLIGRVVGIAAGNRNLAAGLGYYAAALSVYENFLHPGHDVVFAKDTRIEIETTPLRAPVLKPDGQ